MSSPNTSQFQQQQTTTPSQQQNEKKLLKRTLTNKNRQICTLNRIISNLRSEINSLQQKLLEQQELLTTQKKTINEFQTVLKEKQIKQMKLIKQEQQLLNKINQSLEKKEEEKSKELARQKSEESLKDAFIIDMKKKCAQLERQNSRLGAELQFKSEAENKVRQSRESDRQMSLRGLVKSPREIHYPRNKKDEINPFEGILRSHKLQPYLQLSRMSQRSRKIEGDNTWCRIQQLMSQNFSVGNGLTTSRSGKNQFLWQDNTLKNKSQIDAESAIELIRQQNERIKISLR